MRDINFFTTFINTNKKSRNRIIYIVFSALLISTITMVSLYGYNKKTKELKSEINKNNSFLESVENKEKINEIEKLKFTTDIMRKYIDVSNVVKDRIENLNKINSELIKSISRNIPDRINLDEISISSQEIVFSGNGLDKIAIAQFEYNLKKVFDDVYIYTISKDNELGYSFDGKIKIKGDSNEIN